MKKLHLGFLFLIPTLVFAGCGKNNGGDQPGGDTPKALADYGYGNAKDGAELKGSWTYENSILQGDSLEGNGVVFKDEFKVNYSLSFNIKLLGSKEGVRYYFGGYIYYKDSENNAKFSITKDKISIESTKGYDTQIVESLYPASYDFAQGVKVEATKSNDLFELYLNDTLVTSLKEEFTEEGQFGMIAGYAKAEFSDIKFQDLGAFTAKNIENDIYTPASGMPGTWEINGNSVNRIDDDPTTAKFESVVFNSAVATNYSFEATIKKGVDIPGGYNLYGVVSYYRNATNYAICFFKDIYVDVYVMLNGVAKWTGGVADPNLPSSGISVLKVQKVGPRIDLYVNGAYLRTIESELYNAPGSVGFDTNGAGAEFRMVSLQTNNTLENPLYKPNLMVGISNDRLLVKDGEAYKALDPYGEYGPSGTNYGFVVFTHGNVFGNSYKYEVTLNTRYLTDDAANAIGIYGGISDSSSVALLLRADGTIDLYGSFLYEGENKEYIEVADTYAGLAKAVPDSCKTDGVLNQNIKMSVEYNINEFKFSINGVEVYKITAKTFNITWPGIAANFVGAGFSF